MPDRTKSANSSSSNIYKPGKKPINKNLIGSAVLSPSNVFFGNTTTAREFKAPMRRHFAIRAKNKNFGGDSLKNSPFAYTTTYRHDFIRFKTDKLPERKREALKLR